MQVTFTVAGEQQAVRLTDGQRSTLLACPDWAFTIDTVWTWPSGTYRRRLYQDLCALERKGLVRRSRMWKRRDAASGEDKYEPGWRLLAAGRAVQVQLRRERR